MSLLLTGVGSNNKGNGSFNPSQLNADVYFDATALNQSVNNSFGNNLLFYKTTNWKNQSTKLGASNFIQNNLTLTPNLIRQEVAGKNALFLKNYYTNLQKYSAINYEYTDSFYISFSLKTIATNNQVLLDSRDINAQKGMAVTMSGGKVRFIFSDVLNVLTLSGFIVVEMDTVITDNNSHEILIQNTNGTAIGISFYLDGNLQTKTIINNIVGSTIKSSNDYYLGSSYSNLAYIFNGSISHLIVNSGIASAPTITNLYNYFLLQNIWLPIKELTNPIISGTTYLGVQSYPPYVIKVGSTYYAYVGSTANYIVVFTSSDGITFTQTSTVLTVGTGFDSVYISPLMVREVGGIYYLFYLAEGADVGLSYTLAYATCSTPTGAFLRQASPQFTVAEYNAVFNRNMEGIIITDVVKVSGTYYWYGTAVDACRCDVFYGTSSTLTGTITPQAILFKSLDVDNQRNLIQGVRVAKISWGWLMTYTVALQGEDKQERNIRSAYCLTALPTAFTNVNEDALNVLIDSWEEKRVYGSMFLKQHNDDSYQNLIQVGGKYRHYYSGHSLGTSTSVNQGLTGLAYYNTIPNLTTGRPLPTQQQPTQPIVITSIANLKTVIDINNSCYYDTNLKIWQVNNVVDINNVSVSTDSERPLYVASGINGLPIARMDGTNRFLLGRFLGNPTSWTMFFVCKVSDYSSANGLCGSENYLAQNQFAKNVIYLKTDGSIRGIIGNDTSNLSITDTTAGDIPINTAVIITATYTDGDNFVRFYKNGALLSNNIILGDVSNTGSVVRNFCVGSAGDYVSINFKGDISYYANYARVLNNTERTNVQNYLKSLYGL